MSPQGVHSKNQTAFRLEPELLARLKDGAKRHGQTMTDIVARGTEAELDRLDGIITDRARPEAVSPPPAGTRKVSADTAPAATFRSARAHALTCKCGICKTRKNGGQQ